MSCEDQALFATECCTQCRLGFDANGAPIYPRLVLRGRFWCCPICEASYGDNPHPNCRPAAALTEIHNRDAGDIVARIVRPTLEAGGQMTDVLVLLESVVVGVALVAIKLGGDEIVLDQVLAGARARLAEQRLGPIEPAGRG